MPHMHEQLQMSISRPRRRFSARHRRWCLVRGSRLTSCFTLLVSWFTIRGRHILITVASRFQNRYCAPNFFVYKWLLDTLLSKHSLRYCYWWLIHKTFRRTIVLLYCIIAQLLVFYKAKISIISRHFILRRISPHCFLDRRKVTSRHKMLIFCRFILEMEYAYI